MKLKMCSEKSNKFLFNILSQSFNVWKVSLLQININNGLFPFLTQKIEVLNEDEEDDDDDDDYNGDLVSSDIEQIQNLLEFKVNTHTRARTHRLQLYLTNVC